MIRKLRAGVMPPQGRPRPEAPQYAGLISALEHTIDRAAADRPNPGDKPTLHRLNRVEYQNAIRDVLAIDVNMAELLPEDEVTSGLDNIASALTMSPTLVDRYLAAAEKVSRLAVGSAALPTEAMFRVSYREQQSGRHVDGLPLGTRGGTLIRHTFPVDAEYDISVELTGSASPADTNMLARDDLREQRLEIAIDGEVVESFVIGDKRMDRSRQLDVTGGGRRYGTDGRPTKVRLPVAAGPHEVGVYFVVTPSAVGYPESLRRPYERGWVKHTGGRPLMNDVANVVIGGPFNVLGPGDTPSRRRIFRCRPTDAVQELSCARRIVRELAGRGYRRPVNDADVEVLMQAYEFGRKDGGFERGIERAVWQLLVSPEFLFRIEAGRAPSAPPGGGQENNYPISDLELASRLSFFLWSTIPDDELLQVAARGELRGKGVFARQVRRMLADDRANALVDNFVGQWLYLRSIPKEERDHENFPNFDETLKDAIATETRLFFESLIREDRSILDVLRADYTFVNGRLARHYDIPNVQGSHFRRVTYPDDKRRGILGQASLFMVTSRPNRTSPVLRGKWIMENILGVPPPPPPANVPPLQEQEVTSQRPKTMRERMAAHRENPVCASCHSVIDPLGFGLENFDAAGAWRDFDKGFTPIDASGTLPDGTPFKDVREFREAVLRNPENFVMTFTEKFLAYAVGRVVDYRDMPAIRKIVKASAVGDYRFSALVLGVIESVPFQMRTGAE